MRSLLPFVALLTTVSCTLPRERDPIATGPEGTSTTGSTAGEPSAQTRPRVGAIRWDAWHTPRPDTEHGAVGGPVGAMIRSLGPERYHYRLPFFAGVAGDGSVNMPGYTPAVMAREIAFARAGGLDYWAFLLYAEGNSMSEGLDAYLQSPDRGGVGFCAIASPNTFGGRDDFDKGVKRLVGLIGEPGYERVMDDRPLLYLFNVTDEWIEAWGGAQAAGELADRLRHGVVAAGHGNPYLVVMDFSPDHGRRIAEILGAQAISSYATGGSVQGAQPYRDLARKVEGFWSACEATGAEVVPIAMAGWDRRPRIEHPVPWESYQKPGVGIESYYEMPTPGELAAHIGNAMQFVELTPGTCPARTVIVYAWNEHDEGGYLCPTRAPDGSPDTSRLDAIAAMLRGFRALDIESVPDMPHIAPVLWLDAADADTVTVRDGHVWEWRDRSGNGHHAQAAGPGITWLGAETPGRGLLFSETGAVMGVDSLRENRPLTVVTVTRRSPDTVAPPYGRILSYYSGDTPADGVPADWVAPSWCVAVMDPTPYPTRVTVTTVGQVDGLRIGSSMAKDGDDYRGEICEILILPGHLNWLQERRLRASLTAKHSDPKAERGRAP
jgi:hypothetical protein